MRILLDVSVLGLGHAFPELRGGTFRVHENLAAGLAGSGECELVLCANHSSVAFAGCVEYLRTNPALRDCSLLGPPPGRGRTIGRILRAGKRWVRPLFPGGMLPAPLRTGGHRLDRHLHPPVLDASPAVHVLHSLGARLPPPVPGRQSPPRLVNIYDLAPLRLPERYAASPHLAEARLAGVGPRDWVITTSESTRRDLGELAGVDPSRVFVIPLAADPRIFRRVEAERVETLRDRLGLGADPYLLVVHAADPRKNIVAAIRAFSRAVRDGGARDLALVLAGPRPTRPDVRAALAEAEDVGARVVLPGYVTDEELAGLYTGALAFVYPSLYEGFGLPPLEAMQCGTPVIAGRVASLPEVVGDAGILVELEEPDALAAAMLRLYGDADLRERLGARSLGRAAGFTWSRCTRQTLDAYRAITMADA